MVLLALVIVFLVYLLVGFGCGLPGDYPDHPVEINIANHVCSLGEVYKPWRESRRIESFLALRRKAIPWSYTACTCTDGNSPLLTIDQLVSIGVSFCTSLWPASSTKS